MRWTSPTDQADASSSRTMRTQRKQPVQPRRNESHLGRHIQGERGMLKSTASADLHRALCQSLGKYQLHVGIGVLGKWRWRGRQFGAECKWTVGRSHEAL